MNLGDKIKNKAQEASGKAKAGVGDATDNHSLEAEGRGDQAEANTRQAGENRDECRVERPTGSKLKKLDCMSAGDRQNHRDGARAYMEKPRVCGGPNCGQ